MQRVSVWQGVARLRVMRARLGEATRQYYEAGRPRLTDTSLMGELVRISRDTGGNDTKYGSTLACATLLAYYSPMGLAGKRIGNNMRTKMATALQCPPTYVSKQKNIILFLYATNNKMRRDLDEIAGRVETFLEERKKEAQQ